MKTVFLTKWRERLNDPTGIRKYVRLSHPWATCATGDRVFQELGRRSKNYVSSLSSEATTIGIAFGEAVVDGNVKKAQEMLEKIENFESIWKWDEKPKPSPICDSCGHDSTEDDEKTINVKRSAKKTRKPRA